MANKKRTFISIDLPDEVKARLKDLHNTNIYHIKWMPDKNYHITLNFLGELKQEEIETVKEIMSRVAREYQPFILTLEKVQAKRHMIWVVAQLSEDLHWLRKELRNRLKGEGIGKRERRKYIPHVLVGKAKKYGRKLRWKDQGFEPIEFEVDRINLYESELTPEAATHTLIEEFELGKTHES